MAAPGTSDHTSTHVRFYLSYCPKTTLKSSFLCENALILPYIYFQRYYGHQYITLPKFVNTSGLSILMHGVISLQDMMPYDKIKYRSYLYDYF